MNRESNRKKALITASVASMIDLFNMDNIHILQVLGYEVEVATNFEFGSITSQARVDEFRRELDAAGIPNYHIPIPRRISDIKHIIASYQMMKKLCERESYDIVHTQSPIGGVVTRLATRKLRKKGMKVIYTAHGFHFYTGGPKKNWMVFYPIERFLSRLTDVIITINQEDYARAKKFGHCEVAYVPGIGIDLNRFHHAEAKVEVTANQGALCSDIRDDQEKVPEQKNNQALRSQIRSPFGLAADDFVVLSVGQLSKRKNQQAIIHAMSRIDNEKVKYLLVGLGEMEDEYRRLVQELHLEQRVIFAGYQKQVNEILQAADCFAFPSLQEGLPVSLMEAMAAGVPVVCSRIRGNVDLVEDGVSGILVDTMDVEGYARGIESYVKKPEQRKQYTKAAGEKIQGFRRECVKEKMEEIYRGDLLVQAESGM